MEQWICNKCGYVINEKPKKNTICKNCGGRIFRNYKRCECGKWFHPDKLKRKFCSVECGIKYKKKGGKKGKHYPNTQRAEIKICPICKKKFRAIHDYKKRKQVYCSKECWKNRKKHKEIKCLNCDKKFIQKRDEKFCCKECYYEFEKTLRNEKSNAWKGGKTKETKLRRTRDEYKEWRLKVFQRDNFKCQRCGSNKNLEAHHIKEISKYPELAYEIKNGLTLCHQCHKLTDNYGYKAELVKGE